ncbi:G-protein coupled receptor GRL101-like protein [Trichoplax sp. H2]|nr:G-protein coupled receptor GRL101-like protein [Trichoplax sp. H2]|eukprot:RDD41878.1 G-protein coupled receptor GRL101-like protein [Trichoplax sp. H2]
MIVTLTRIRKQANRQISSVEKIIQAKMIAIVITDLICWMPLYIVLLRFLFGYGLDTHSLPFIAVLSLPVNSCINPIFYTIFTRTFLNKANNMIRQLRNILTLCQVYLYQCHSNSSSQSFETSGENHKDISILSKETKCLTQTYYKIKLTDKNNNGTFGLIKFYDANNKKDWQSENKFYRVIASNKFQLQNIIQLLSLAKETEHNIIMDMPFNDIYQKLFSCYESPHIDQDVQILSTLIRSQSKDLTSVNVLRIIEDIVKAISSLQAHLIVHGGIDTNAIIIYIPTAIKPIKAVLGNFTASQILENNRSSKLNQEIENKINKNVTDLAQLYYSLSSYCQSKITMVSCKYVIDSEQVYRQNESIVKSLASFCLLIIYGLEKEISAINNHQRLKTLQDYRIDHILPVLQDTIKNLTDIND